MNRNDSATWTPLDLDLTDYAPCDPSRVPLDFITLDVWPPSGRFRARAWARSILEMIERVTG